MVTHARTVREAMTPSPRSVSKDASVVEAARLMIAEDVGSLPVVRGSELVGIVTDRDLVAEVMAKELDPNKTLVADVCSEEPTVVSPDEPLDATLHRMASERVRRLPVVEQGRLVGILSEADVARHAAHESTGGMLEHVTDSSES
jgi:CBS domain-containing protein